MRALEPLLLGCISSHMSLLRLFPLPNAYLRHTQKILDIVLLWLSFIEKDISYARGFHICVLLTLIDDRLDTSNWHHLFKVKVLDSDSGPGI